MKKIHKKYNLEVKAGGEFVVEVENHRKTHSLRGDYNMKLESIKKKLKNHIPWKIRLKIKLLEIKYPRIVPHFLKQKSDPEHYNEVFYNALRKMDIENFEGKTICELGPGQFLSHALLTYQMGGVSSYLLEIDDFANQKSEIKVEKNMILDDSFRKIRKLPRPKDHITWQQYLQEIDAKYYTDGIDGYLRVPSDTIDYMFSFSVIEHIRKNVFKKYMEEAYRMLKQGGLAYHTVDLKDHLGGGKNQLRYPDSVWEDEIHYRLDNYTNRLSCTEICSLLEEIGYEIVGIEKKRYKEFPIKRNELSKEFRDIPDDDLLVSDFTIILKK